MNVNELDGARLDHAVALLEGLRVDGIRNHEVIVGETPNRYVYAPSENWAQGGPIIERERIEIGFMGDDHGWQAAMNPEAQADWQLPWHDGPTPLVAAMRAFVASKFGEEVDLKSRQCISRRP